MGKSSLSFIIPLAIFIFIFSAHLSNAKPLGYHPVANLSTTWINNPGINVYSNLDFPGFTITPVLSLSNTSQFISGFYCFPNETSCFFGIVIFTARYDNKNYTEIYGTQLVWSTNRDRPVKVNATFKLTGDGDLELEDTDGTLVWSTETGQNKSVTGLRFTEFGNLVLFDRNNRTVWQSFDHPTDSLLIGQKLMIGQKLIASKSSSDISRSLFSLSLQFDGLFGYVDTNDPPLMYYQSNLEAAANFTNWKEEYVAFQNVRKLQRSTYPSWVDSSVHEAGTRWAFEGLRKWRRRMEGRGGFARFRHFSSMQDSTGVQIAVVEGCQPMFSPCSLYTALYQCCLCLL